MKFVAIILAAFSSLAQAQSYPCPCHPLENGDEWFAVIHSTNVFGGPGPWIKWACYPQAEPGTPGAPRYCTLAEPWPTTSLRKIGDRIDTIRNAVDVKASFVASLRRHVTLPISTEQGSGGQTHESLVPLRDAIMADEAAKVAKGLL